MTPPPPDERGAECFLVACLTITTLLFWAAVTATLGDMTGARILSLTAFAVACTAYSYHSFAEGRTRPPAGAARGPHRPER